MEKKKTLLLTIATTTLLALSVALFMINNVGAFVFNIQADNNPYTLNLNRSISASELSAGQANFNTTNGNPISFKFDSSKASASSGLITLSAGGYFYNDTKITGITKIETTLSSGSATLIYGNDKSSLHIGSESLSGTSQITINLSTPSDYFKITEVSSSLSISSIKITYSCFNSPDQDIHEGAEEFTSSNAWADGLPNHYFVSPEDSKVIDVNTDIIAFDVKFISNSGVLSFYLNQYYYGNYCGPFALSTSRVLTGAGASLTPLEDGWHRITINLPATAKGGDPEFVSRVNLSGTTANGFIKYMGKVEPDILEGAKEFTSSSAWADGTVNYYFVSPADSQVLDMSNDTIAFDVMFWSNSGVLSFYLNEFYYGRFCGPFVLSTTGVLTGKGAYLTSLEDGWYRITINLSETTKSATEPEYVSRVNLSGTTANGFIKYMGTVPDIHEGAKEFTSSNTWADGTDNYYFVSPADSQVLDMSNDTIAFDVKFSSDSGVSDVLSFYLNEYFYARFCGPFALSTTGVLTGKGASLTSLGEVWYRITIDLSKTTKSATEPEYVSRINLSGTTANGFIKYMGTIK